MREPKRACQITTLDSTAQMPSWSPTVTDATWYHPFKKLGMPGALGMEIVELSENRVVATMPVDERTVQPFGILHGGASVALAETVASIGALANVDRAEYAAVGLEINA